MGNFERAVAFSQIIASAYPRSLDKEMESPVLDLSLKKPAAISIPSFLTNVRGSAQCRPGEELPRLILAPRSRRPDQGSKSPFEGRTCMVTPPSESESPKKSPYQTMCNVPVEESRSYNAHYPMLPTPSPPLYAQQPNPTSTTRETNDIINGKKAPRPFKAYPKDPSAFTCGPDITYNHQNNENYTEFRKRMLESVKNTNEGTNIKMRRVSSRSPGLPTSTMDDRDAAYWERRRKNNEAAKRSRDARRAKEDEIAIRAAFLEQENIKLKYELVTTRNENAKLRNMLMAH